MIHHTSPKPLFEIRLVAPVFVAWCLLFFGLLSVGITGERVGSEGQLIPINYLGPLLYGLGFVGFWMTIVWGCLAGNAFWRWIVTPSIPVGVALMTELSVDLARSNFPITIFVAIISGVAILPVATVRRVARWRIVWGERASAPVSGPLSLKAIFVFISLLAALFALARLGTLDGWKDTVLRATVCILPVIWAFLLPALMSRLPIRYVWPVTLVIGALLALVAAWCVTNADSRSYSGRQVSFLPEFLPILMAYLTGSAGWLLAATYLRWRGVLFQFGGVTGFALPPGVEQTAPVTRRTFLAISASCILLAVAVGGTMYHRHWVLRKWPIPKSPEQAQLHRLFRIASFHPRRYSPETDLGPRRQEARRAVATLGPETVPFLLQQINPIRDERHADNGRTFAATNILQRLARQDALGEHAAAVISKVTTDPEAYDAAAILGCIGKPAIPAIKEALNAGKCQTGAEAIWILDSVWGMDAEVTENVLPALHRACRVHDGSELLYAVLTRVAGADALPTLREVIRSEAKSPRSRVVAARCIAGGSLGTEGASLVPDIVELLGVLQDSEDAARVIQALGQLGPSAHEATRPLLTILRERNADGGEPEMTHPNGGYGDYGRMMGDEHQTPLFVEAAIALGRMQAREAVPDLIALLEDEALGAATKQVLVEALGDIGPAAKPATALLKELSRMSPQDEADRALRGSAFVALARIHIRRGPQLIESVLRRIGELQRQTTKTSEPADADEQLVSALVRSLVWLGGKNDPSIMAAPDANPVRVGQIRFETTFHSPELTLLVEATNSVAKVLDGKPEWTAAGPSVALCRALETGLESTDESIQRTAADIWFATMWKVPAQSAQTTRALLAFARPSFADADRSPTLHLRPARHGDHRPTPQRDR